jgi:hypothetical protein
MASFQSVKSEWPFHMIGRLLGRNMAECSVFAAPEKQRRLSDFAKGVPWPAPPPPIALMVISVVRREDST